MWYTTRYEGFDAPGSGGGRRVPSSLAAVQRFCSATLRAGLLLQFIGLTGLFLSFYAFRGSTGMFTYDLLATSEEQRSRVGFRVALAIFSAVYLIGSLHLLSFQATLSDDASYPRGFRAGAKFLGIATFLDVASAALLTVFYCYMRANYDKVWWSQFSSGGVEWLVFNLARLLHAFALLYFAAGFFLIEVYHDRGTNDWHAVLNAFLYAAAGVAQLVVLLWLRSGSPAACAIHWVTLVAAIVWAMPFEQELNASSPKFNEVELVNDVEAEIERHAQNSPYIPVR